jgi:hypothetical protein
MPCGIAAPRHILPSLLLVCFFLMRAEQAPPAGVHGLALHQAHQADCISISVYPQPVCTSALSLCTQVLEWIVSCT